MLLSYDRTTSYKKQIFVLAYGLGKKINNHTRGIEDRLEEVKNEERKMAKHKFVEFLRSLQENLNFKDNSTDYEIGYRCAVGSINDVIDTQCNLFIVFTENVTETNLYEEDCINNIISILESTLDSKTKDDDFDKGYKKKILGIFVILFIHFDEKPWK